MDILQIDAATWSDTVRNPKSIKAIDHIAALLYTTPQLIAQIIVHLHAAEQAVAWRTAWIIDKIAEKNAALLFPHHHTLVQVLKITPHNSVRRHLTKILANNLTEASHDGELIDKCFSWIIHPKIPIAVKANTMQLLANLCTIYPELTAELIITIEAGLSHATTGYKTKVKNIIKQLKHQPQKVKNPPFP